MTQRRLRLLKVAVAAMLAGLLPPASMLALSYWQAASEADRSLRSYASILQHRADEVFGNAEASLSAVAATIDRNCTAASFEALRRAVYNSLYFREAGLIYQQAVQCTSERILDPPVPITNPDHLLLPLERIHIAAPEQTLEREVSIVVLYRIAEGIGLNLLLNPAQLLEPLHGLADEAHVRLRLERSDGPVLAGRGQDDGGDVLSADSASQRYPVRAVVSASKDWLMRDWRRNAALFFGVGLLLSLPVFLLLRRLERREESMDMQLRDALEAGELCVHYQPIHGTQSGVCVGAEALLRWQHPQRGLILPGVFVPVAEETGFIVPITHWLMRRVSVEMAPVLEAHPGFYIAINLSPKHLVDPTLPDLIRGIFDARFGAGRLVFEVTERELIDSGAETVAAVIDTLRRGGARVALDDFGTGYSSLRYLAQFHFDLLKIDKSFVDAIGTDSVTAGLVDDMVAMARRLGLQTVAEGVESAPQLEHLRALGAEYVQGWYFSRALPVERLKAYLRR